MIVRLLRPAPLFAVLLAGFSGLMACGDSVTTPPDILSSGELFFEPLSFCFTENQDTKILTVFNLANEPLTWTPVSVPAGSQGLSDTLTVDPKTFVDLTLTWSPSGPYPVLDSLVVETSDQTRPRVVVPVARQDPAGFVDSTPPEAPILAVPAEGAEFTLGPGASVAIDLAWSALDDCSGLRYYRLEISRDLDFSEILCCREQIPQAFTTVVAENGDQGVAYWRVYAVDDAGLVGPKSQARSWVVVD
jgi:hypothetical protein